MHRQAPLLAAAVSILTGLERPVQLPPRLLLVSAPGVSILTGLERPVQHPTPGLPPHWVVLVSILTGLERPVQHGAGREDVLLPTFQSSPALKDRCNFLRHKREVAAMLFQSSPALKDRCNPLSDPPLARWKVSILTGLERPVQQSAPAVAAAKILVSILTGLERPVQRSRSMPIKAVLVVSILTGLERPVQHGDPPERRTARGGFNPHRP